MTQRRMSPTNISGADDSSTNRGHDLDKKSSPYPTRISDLILLNNPFAAHSSDDHYSTIYTPSSRANAPTQPTSTSTSVKHLNTNANPFYSTLRTIKKSTLSTHNRLSSILSDSQFIISLHSKSGPYSNYPLIANERCGSWYIPPDLKGGSAYFKSTDGHHGQWGFSPRRLNLDLLRVLGANGGAILVDSTRRGKSLPDAFSKTVPIWVAVVNRALFADWKQGDEGNGWDTSRERREDKVSGVDGVGRLQTPSMEDVGGDRDVDRGGEGDVLGRSEISQIEARIVGFVEQFKGLGLDLGKLRTDLQRPIKIVWVLNGVWSSESGISMATNGDSDKSSTGVVDTKQDSGFNTLVLCSASRRVRGSEVAENGYIQGAGDDSEGWSHGLTPQIFWKYKDELLECHEDDLPDFVAGLIKKEEMEHNCRPQDVLIEPTKHIFLSKGYRGTTTSDTTGEKPYDLVINCECPATQEQNTALVAIPKILDLGCRAGKMGSKDLRDKLGLVKSFVMTMIDRKVDHRILITCSTGKDLSTGVALTLLCLFYNNSGDVKNELEPLVIDKQLIKQRLAWISSSKPDANPSRATLQAVNSFLIERPG